MSTFGESNWEPGHASESGLYSPGCRLSVKVDFGCRHPVNCLYECGFGFLNVDFQLHLFSDVAFLFWISTSDLYNYFLFIILNVFIFNICEIF